MAELFILALLGHLIGDFLLQSKHMALHKTDAGWKGIEACSLHVLIYTTVVCIMLFRHADYIVWLLVFIPHWVIDRWSLAAKWLKLTRGRTFEKAHASTDKYREFDIAFTSVVYAVVDGTFHLLSLWLVIKFVII